MISANNQQRQLYNTRWFQIGVLVALAIALMVGAAFWFGTGLRADTTRSAAASPMGSSLTNFQGSPAVAASPIGSSLTNFRPSAAVAASPIGSSLTNLRGSPAVSASPLGSSLTNVRGIESSAAARSAELQNLAKRWAPFYAGLDKALKDAGARP